MNSKTSTYLLVLNGGICGYFFIHSYIHFFALGRFFNGTRILRIDVVQGLLIGFALAFIISQIYARIKATKVNGWITLFGLGEPGFNKRMSGAGADLVCGHHQKGLAPPVVPFMRVSLSVLPKEVVMFKKHRIAALSTLISVVVLAIPASAVIAAPPLDLHIEADEMVATSGEPFTASGSAVDAGVICASGTVDDVSVTVSGTPGGSTTILHVLKRFNCTDLSGTFDVKLVVRLDNATHATTANWKFVGGSGAYAGLHGNGSLIGTPIIPGTSIHDVYDGTVH